MNDAIVFPPKMQRCLTVVFRSLYCRILRFEELVGVYYLVLNYFLLMGEPESIALQSVHSQGDL